MSCLISNYVKYKWIKYSKGRNWKTVFEKKSHNYMLFKKDTY